MSNIKDLFGRLENEISPLSAQDMAQITKHEKIGLGNIGSNNNMTYTAADIEVLEGLEPVRRRPGMYIGGTDLKAMHHLFAEVIDNSMDEAVAGHASWIEVELNSEGYLIITDNGRGIPVDPHPKFPNKSALEIIMTTLHAGGKFDSKAYETSGGLHGVGISVVNALSYILEVEVARNQELFRQSFTRGIADGPLQSMGKIHNRRGTKVKFIPDPEIFGVKAKFRPATIFKMAQAKAYLFGGVEIRWSCAKELLEENSNIPIKANLHFPEGLKDYMAATINNITTVTDEIFYGSSSKPGVHGSVEWAIVWLEKEGFISSYCNTVPTPEGGTHETGVRTALTRAIKSYGELANIKKTSQITVDDVIGSAAIMLSVFIREPEFQGQTKEKLTTQEASKIVDNAIKDHFDHWLVANPNQANELLDWIIKRAEERLKKKQERDVSRKTAGRKLRLPGKLADCAQNTAEGSELFIVEGDSAGGSAKQARNRKNQAVLPLRGKILNVASAGADKIIQNQQIADLIQALGCGVGDKYKENDLRYEKVIIMTDADVDGAHIASLLITFFFKKVPALINNGHLFLAVPPLYRIKQGNKTLYAQDDHSKDLLLAAEFSGRGRVDISRFKGLGEMLPKQLKETTMDPSTRILLRVEIDKDEINLTEDIVDKLMGNKPEERFNFIKDNAEFAEMVDI